MWEQRATLLLTRTEISARKGTTIRIFFWTSSRVCAMRFQISGKVLYACEVGADHAHHTATGVARPNDSLNPRDGVTQHTTRWGAHRTMGSTPHDGEHTTSTRRHDDATVRFQQRPFRRRPVFSPSSTASADGGGRRRCPQRVTPNQRWATR